MIPGRRGPSPTDVVHPLSEVPESRGSELYGLELSRSNLRLWTGRHEQLFGVDQMILDDGDARGTRVLRVRTGVLDVDVVADRGFDLGGAFIHGVPVAWISPVGVVSPNRAGREGWLPLRSFAGGLLVTCGLDNVHGPATEAAPLLQYPARPAVDYPLHGRLTASRAVIHERSVDLDAAEPCIRLKAEIRQAAVYGENLVLSRTLEFPIGTGRIRVRDVVRNDGYASTPHALLYHVNFGFPLLSPATEVESVGLVDRGGREPQWRSLGLPKVDGGAEQVDEYHVVPGENPMVTVSNSRTLPGDVLTATLGFSAGSLPHLVHWSSCLPTHYVSAFEPSTVGAQGRVEAQQSGRMLMLEPDEQCIYELDIELGLRPHRRAI